MLSTKSAVALRAVWLLQGVWAQEESPSGPILPNTAWNCNKFWKVIAGSSDSCWSITQQFGISLEQFYAWNPDVTDDCGTNFWPEYSYCVGIDPGKASTTSSSASTTAATSTSSSSAPVTGSSTSRVPTTVPPNTEPYTPNWPVTNWTITPTTLESTFPPQRTQPGQPPQCNNWYLVSSADTCDRIVATSSWLTLKDLHAWNPTLGADCSGLYDGWWVCIGMPPTSTESFGWTTTDAPANVPTYTGNYTFTTFPPVDTSFVAEPTQPGIVSGCLSYWQAQDGDLCGDVVDGHYLTEEDFLAMNPALGGKCDFMWKGYYYCVVGPHGITAVPPTATSPPAAVPSGQDGRCQHWFQRSGGESCADIVTLFGAFSLADFLAWNPSVGGESCGGIADGAWYCVGVPGTPTTRTTPLPTVAHPLTPTQSGLVAGCTKLWLVSTIDTCDTIIEANSISSSLFYQWNPSVGSGSCGNLTPDFYVCVAADGSASLPAITTNGPSATTSSGSGTTSMPAITTPTPIQAGMVSGCRRFYKTQPDDGCWAIANSAGIDLNDFFTWNPAVGTDCGGLWKDTWYCIGLEGPATQISSGPPVPSP